LKEPAVTDSTCLIGLERTGHLDILPALFEPVLIPPEVDKEFGISLPWLTIKAPINEKLVAALKMLADDGEAEAIALTVEQKCLIVLDDRQARFVAKHFVTSIIGTVGILLRAKRTGIIPSVRTVLGELEANSFYISCSLKEAALHLAGE